MTMTDTAYKYINQTAQTVNENDGSIEYKRQKMEKLSKIRKEVKEKAITVKEAKEQLKYEKIDYLQFY